VEQRSDEALADFLKGLLCFGLNPDAGVLCASIRHAIRTGILPPLETTVSTIVVDRILASRNTSVQPFGVL
jgi:hypothetical protein